MSKVRHTRLPLLLAALSAVALSACGSSSSSSSSVSSSTASPSTSTTAATTTTASGPTSSVITGAVHAVLTGENHTPKVGKKWLYTLRVTDAAGNKLSGTVNIEFTFGSLVVGHDTPPVHALENRILQELLTFPAQALGHPISLQAVVHTTAGSVTLDWPVTVTQ